MANYGFVDKVPEDYMCSICANVLSDPVLIECCGQHFCEGCLKKWLARQQTCPHCRATDLKYIKNRNVKRNIDALKIYCSNRSRGCKVVSTIGGYNTHLQECLFVLVDCTNKCGETLCRKDLKDHTQRTCPNRQVQCKFCPEEGLYKNITTSVHQDACPGYPVPCPNNCGLTEIKPKDLGTHKEQCPLELVKCPFFANGCDSIVPRKELDAHLVSNTQKHLMKLAACTAQHDSELETMTNSLQILQQKFDNLASCVSQEIKSIKGTSDNTPEALECIGTMLDSVTTMLEPGNTYCVRLTKVNRTSARCPSFYVKPGYKMFIEMKQETGALHLYLERGEHDSTLDWPIKEFDIVLMVRNLQRKSVPLQTQEEICKRCDPSLDLSRIENHNIREICVLRMPRQYATWRDYMYFRLNDHVHSHQKGFFNTIAEFSRIFSVKS